MSNERQYGELDRLIDQHDELDVAGRKLRTENPEIALGALLPLLERHEVAESPAVEAARNTLPAEAISEYEEHWRTLRQLASDLQGVNNPAPDQVDKIVAMLYDHGAELGAVFAKLYLLLDDDDFSALNAKIADAIARTS